MGKRVESDDKYHCLLTSSPRSLSVFLHFEDSPFRDPAIFLFNKIWSHVRILRSFILFFFSLSLYLCLSLFFSLKIFLLSLFLTLTPSPLSLLSISRISVLLFHFLTLHHSSLWPSLILIFPSFLSHLPVPSFLFLFSFPLFILSLFVHFSTIQLVAVKSS
ncbi:unnamed protein product [Acanthosepion pharaonis]|uniref:Transmembrane protein n=1 Tax=Acanthosepion pharaonis TaxID=158019 RepID=A0A812BSZ8_ACAPH|nr:unnamed protein product [Sepia pharaonis]